MNTERDLRARLYDNLPADEAIIKAWTLPGVPPSTREWMQKQVKEINPMLARALDRLEG